MMVGLKHDAGWGIFYKQEKNKTAVNHATSNVDAPARIDVDG